MGHIHAHDRGKRVAPRDPSQQWLGLADDQDRHGRVLHGALCIAAQEPPVLFALTEKQRRQACRPVNSRFMDELLEYATGCDTRFDRSSELHAQSLCSVLKSSTPRPEHRILPHQKPGVGGEGIDECTGLSGQRSLLADAAADSAAASCAGSLKSVPQMMGFHESTHSSRARQGSGEG